MRFCFGGKDLQTQQDLPTTGNATRPARSLYSLSLTGKAGQIDSSLARIEKTRYPTSRASFLAHEAENLRQPTRRVGHNEKRRCSTTCTTSIRNPPRKEIWKPGDECPNTPKSSIYPATVQGFDDTITLWRSPFSQDIFQEPKTTPEGSKVCGSGGYDYRRAERSQRR